jgi:hypothetical protein
MFDSFNRNLMKNTRFKLWHTRKTHETLTGKSIEKRVDEMLGEKYLAIEGKDESGRWVPITEGADECSA